MCCGIIIVEPSIIYFTSLYSEVLVLNLYIHFLYCTIIMVSQSPIRIAHSVPILDLKQGLYL